VRLPLTEAIHVHDGGHLSDREIARATGAAPSTVREWLARRSSPSGARAERLVELSSLVERLGRVIRPDLHPGLAEQARPPRSTTTSPSTASPPATTAQSLGSSPASRTRAQADVPLSVTALAVRGRWIKHTYPGSAPLPAREPPPDNRW
jgi:hypothetical protein